MANTSQQERAGEICKCGHSGGSHYSARAGTVRNPCHHLGAHDTRCTCRDYDPTPGAKLAIRPVVGEVERRRVEAAKADKAVQRAEIQVREAVSALHNAAAQQALAYDRLERAENKVQS